MKSIISVAVVVVAFTTAGCISKADVAPVSAAAPVEVSGMFSEMHAAIPASKNNGKFFDYN